MNKLAGNNPNLEQLKIDNPKQWFREILCDADFIELEYLQKETNLQMDWDVLIRDGVYEIENGKLLGIRWPGDLILNYSDIKNIGKLKGVLGDLSMAYTNIECSGDLEYVGGDLDVRGENIKLQLDIIEKVESGSLEVKGKIYFGEIIADRDSLLVLNYIPGSLDLQGMSIDNLGNIQRIKNTLYLRSVTNLNNLGELTYVGGNLILVGTNFFLQLEVIEKINKGTLKVVGGVYLDYGVKKYFKDNELNYEEFFADYGSNINLIMNNESKIFYKKMLQLEFTRLLKIIIDDVRDIQDKAQIGELNRKIQKIKEQFLEYGINPDEIDISDIINE